MLQKQLLDAKNVETWEESATKTVAALFGHLQDYADLYESGDFEFNSIKFTNDHVLNMKHTIDYMIDTKIWESDPRYISFLFDDENDRIKNEYNHIIPWATLSLCSISFFKEYDSTFEYSDYQHWIKKVVIAKQRDYGPNNIARFGINGLVIRIHDKIARLQNLLNKNKSPQNESVSDTLLDVIGYSIVALMWINGTFLLPLQSEYIEKNLTEDEIFFSIEQSPINRHSKIPNTGTAGFSGFSDFIIHETSNVEIVPAADIEIDFGKINAKHPNPKFR